MTNHDIIDDITAQLARLDAEARASVFGPGWVCLNDTLIVPEFRTFATLSTLPDGLGTRKTLEAIING